MPTGSRAEIGDLCVVNCLRFQEVIYHNLKWKNYPILLNEQAEDKAAELLSTQREWKAFLNMTPQAEAKNENIGV